MFDGREVCRALTTTFLRELSATWNWYHGNRVVAMLQNEALLEKEPTNWAALYFVLTQLQSEGRDVEALAIAVRALEKDPSCFFALQRAATSSVTLGRHEEARAFVERALVASPDYSGLGLRFLDSVAYLVWRLARLLKRPKALSEPFEAPSLEASRALHHWMEWARGYVAWHKGRSEAGKMSSKE